MAITPKSYLQINKELTDALSAANMQQLQSGSVLQVESIASIMQQVTFQSSHIVIWPYMKYPPEYQQLLHFLAKLEIKIR